MNSHLISGISKFFMWKLPPSFWQPLVFTALDALHAIYLSKTSNFTFSDIENIFVRDYRNNLSQIWLRIHACLSHMRLIWKSEVFYHVICNKWMLFQYEMAKAFKPVPYFALQDHVGLISNYSYGPSMASLLCPPMGLVLFYKWTSLDVSGNIIYSTHKSSVTSGLLQKCFI